MKKYNDWLSEGSVTEPKKPAQHNVDDIVTLKHDTYSGYWMNDVRRSDFKASNNDIGLVVKIIQKIVKNGKWYYLGKIIYGGYWSWGKGSRAGSYSNSYHLLFNDSNCEDKKVTDDLLKLFKEAKFNIGDTVNVPKGTDCFDEFKTTEITHDITGKISFISVNMSRKYNEICYIIDKVNPAKAVLESSIEPEIKMDEHAAEEIIKAIEDKIGLKLAKKWDGWIVKFPYIIDAANKKLLPEKLYFSSKENCENFIDELKNLIEKYTKEQLKLFPRNIKTSKDENVVTTSETWCPSIDKEKITQTARHLDIDIKGVLHDKRGTIIGKKFGL